MGQGLAVWRTTGDSKYEAHDLFSCVVDVWGWIDGLPGEMGLNGEDEAKAVAEHSNKILDFLVT